MTKIATHQIGEMSEKSQELRDFLMKSVNEMSEKAKAMGFELPEIHNGIFNALIADCENSSQIAVLYAYAEVSLAINMTQNQENAAIFLEAVEGYAAGFVAQAIQTGLLPPDLMETNCPCPECQTGSSEESSPRLH